MTEPNRQSGEKEERIIEIEIERLRPFKEHPFQVKDDKEMFLLQESIEKYGILNPLIVRPVPDLPYNRLYSMMEYKLKMYGIRFVRQEESYTSQCSPLSPEVEKRYAQPCNRKQRGLYRDRNRKYNADAVGAYNILRKYLSVSGEKKELSVTGLKTPEIIKVAV